MSNVFYNGRWIGVTNPARHKWTEDPERGPWTIVYVRAYEFDEAFRRGDLDTYVGQNGENGIGGRYERFQCFICVRNQFKASTVYVDDDGGVEFRIGVIDMPCCAMPALRKSRSAWMPCP